MGVPARGELQTASKRGRFLAATASGGRRPRRPPGELSRVAIGAAHARNAAVARRFCGILAGNQRGGNKPGVQRSACDPGAGGRRRGCIDFRASLATCEGSRREHTRDAWTLPALPRRARVARGPPGLDGWPIGWRPGRPGSETARSAGDRICLPGVVVGSGYWLAPLQSLLHGIARSLSYQHTEIIACSLCSNI